MKQIVWIGEILIDPYKGIYKQHVWYTDGSFEEQLVPKGLIIIPKIMWY